MKCSLNITKNDYNTILADRTIKPTHIEDTETISTYSDKEEIPLDDLLSPQNLKTQTIGPFETINMEFSSNDNKIKSNQFIPQPTMNIRSFD